MDDSSLLAYVKSNMRIDTTAYDDSEISPLIASAKADIEAYTGAEFDLDDEMECLMVVLYVRARFGDGDDRAELLYEKEKQKLGIRKMGAEST